MAAPIDFTCETTNGTERSLSEHRGKVILLAIESQEAAGKNELLHEYLREEARRNAELLSKMALVPVASLSKASSNRMMRGLIRPIIVGAARAKGIEIWMDWDGLALRSLGAQNEEHLSHVVVVGPDLVPRWRWAGVCPKERWPELIGVIRHLASAVH